MKTINDVVGELKDILEKAYEHGLTFQEAEKVASQTLSLRIALADELRAVDLDAKMKKHGVKAVRAAVYMEEIKKHEKKPAEAYLDNAVNLSPLVEQEERAYATAQVNCDHLVTYLDIMKDAHIFFRTVAKGNFE